MARNLTEMRTILTGLLHEAQQEAIAKSAAAGEDPGFTPESGGDEADRANAIANREMQLILDSRDTNKLRQIKAALNRLEAGEYGICDECEEDIPLGRLKVMPFAKYCVQCQSSFEKHQAQTRSVERFDLDAVDSGSKEDEAGDEE